MVLSRPFPFPGLAEPLTTLSDKVGRWPRLPCVPFALAADAEGALDRPNGGAFICARDDRRLCALEALIDCPLLCNPPLPSVFDCPACGLWDSADRAMFLNVMMHSICSPAYTAGSFHCTYARMFDGADGVCGIVDNATA